MELFPSQPDLNLNISRRREEQDDKEQEQVERRLVYQSQASDSVRNASGHLIDTVKFTSNYEPTKIYHYQEHNESQDQDSRSILMVSQNQTLGHYYYSPTPPFFFSEVNGQHANPNYSYKLHHRHRRQAQPQPQRCTAKRGVRAPRMRWTTTLHAHFVRAVQFLGGHERATPKSVLELMDVQDLTLAHVKSHLQLFPSQPDLNLNISRRREEQDDKEQEQVKRRLVYQSQASDSVRNASGHLIDTVKFTSDYEPTKIYHYQEHNESQDQDSRSILMVSQNQTLGRYYYSPTPPVFFSEVNGQHANPNYSYKLHHGHRRQAQPQPQRCTAKRGVRAPRMRWTTTLHAHFVRAVQLLGGHERATPKSVLELMDVQDLTLAHVKSHLQICSSRRLLGIRVPHGVLGDIWVYLELKRGVKVIIGRAERWKRSSRSDTVKSL
ncbi:hypothetical protein F2Q69_00060212 [Brassica cretica]|uniref:Myb-like domain-containing protein n=1 Tax=Brassica cretica TaxID=69181 RepID=A0A8S9RCU6_BRACR|nr:hypothetical protein F2Q69_00060212 [Brassica cretica]